MNYSVQSLSTVADCQVLIDMAEREKKKLAERKMGFERKHETATLSSPEIEANLVAATGELQSVQSAYETTPDGPTREELADRLLKVKYKKFQLEERKENYGVLALVEREFGIATIGRSTLEADDLIAQLTARMDEL